MLDLETCLSKTREAAYDYPWPLDLEGMEAEVEAMAAIEGLMAICLKEGRLIGLFRLVPKGWRFLRTYDMGYAIHPDCWGKGFATEAAQEVVRHAFTRLGAWRVHAGSAVDNLASRRV